MLYLGVFGDLATDFCQVCVRDKACPLPDGTILRVIKSAPGSNNKDGNPVAFELVEDDGKPSADNVNKLLHLLGFDDERVDERMGW